MSAPTSSRRRTAGFAPAGFSGDLMAVVAVIGAIAVIYGSVQHFYFEGAFLDAISYVNDERPLNSIVAGLLGQDPSITAVGIHAFGDFLLPHYWVTLTNPWLQDGTNMINYLPPALVPFRVLSAVPYQVALGAYELAMFIALATPMAYATRGMRWSHRVLSVVVLGLFAGPAIASLDRANTQGFVPIFLFAAAIAMLRERWGWASVFLVAAGSLKIYPLALVLVMLAARKWKWAAVSVFGTFLLSVVTLPLVSQDLSETFRLVFLNPLNYDDRTFVQFMSYNVSFAGGVAHGFQLLGLSGAAEWVAGHGLLFGLFAFVITAPLLWTARIELWVRIILAMLLTTSVMPVSYPYAMNWVVAAAAVAVAMSIGARGSAWFTAHSMPRWQWLPVFLGLALLVPPYPFFVPGSMEQGIPVSALALVSAFVSVALPLALWAGRWRTRGTHEHD